MKRVLIVVTAIVTVVCTVVFLLFLINGAHMPDWAQLLGGFFGGVAGSIALVYAALETLGEQRSDKLHKEQARKVRLLSAIWAESRVAFEVQKNLIERLCNFGDRLRDGDPEKTTALIRSLRIFETVRMNILDKNLEKIALFDNEICDILFNLDFELKMQQSVWRIDHEDGSTFGSEDVKNFRIWASRVFARLFIGRLLLARTLLKRDEMAAGARICAQLDNEEKIIIGKILGNHVTFADFCAGVKVSV